jgi:hypothetical protein
VIDLLGFAAVVLIFLGAGVALGMLVAPRLTRMAERDDEDPGDDERA